jgi:hypothetical protein
MRTVVIHDALSLVVARLTLAAGTPTINQIVIGQLMPSWTMSTRRPRRLAPIKHNLALMLRHAAPHALPVGRLLNPQSIPQTFLNHRAVIAELLYDNARPMTTFGMKHVHIRARARRAFPPRHGLTLNTLAAVSAFTFSCLETRHNVTVVTPE